MHLCLIQIEEIDLGVSLFLQPFEDSSFKKLEVVRKPQVTTQLKAHHTMK